MGYILTQEEEALCERTRAFFTDGVRREIAAADVSGEWPKALYDRAHEAGIDRVILPPEYGGPGAPMPARAAAFEEIAQADAGMATTYMVSGIVVETLAAAESKELAERAAAHLRAGRFGAFCLSEPGSGSDAGSVCMTAEKCGDSYVLNGLKSLVTDGPQASFYVVFVKTAPEKGLDGMSAFYVEGGTAGITIGSLEDKLGVRTSSTCDIIFRDVVVPAENLIGEENMGFRYAMAALDCARIWSAVTGIGVAERAIRESVRYAKSRIQFKRPISRFQAIQMKISDMWIRTESARQLMVQAIRLKEAGLPFSVEAAAAKAAAGDAAMFSAEEAVQIHGAAGYNREHPVEKLFRDAKVIQIYEGTSEIQRIVVGRGILGREEYEPSTNRVPQGEAKPAAGGAARKDRPAGRNERNGRLYQEGLDGSPEEIARCVWRDLAEAGLPRDPSVVICAGNGIRSKETFDALKAAAEAAGAEFGVTRPLVDLGWADGADMIGATGRRIAPDLYIAVGVSGAAQHIGGVLGSGVIVAVNRDPQAAVFRFADIGIVCSAETFVPVLGDLLPR